MQSRLYIIRPHKQYVKSGLKDFEQVIATSFQEAIEKSIAGGVVTHESEIGNISDKEDVIL